MPLQMPETFAQWLELREYLCMPVAYTNAPHISFPCGLTLAGRLAMVPAGANGPALLWVHEQHHKNGHNSKDWAIVERVEQREGTVTLRFSCQCSKSLHSSEIGKAA